jgi:hypothetical protein
MGKSMPAIGELVVQLTMAGSAFIWISLQVLPLIPLMPTLIPGSDTTSHHLQSSLQCIVALTPKRIIWNKETLRG